MYKNIPIDNQVDFHNQVLECQPRNYSCPTDHQSYWKVIDQYWADLMNIILTFSPEIEVNKEGIIEKTSVYITRLKEQRNIELINYFNKTWAAAPDDGQIHLIPCWHILCDLCSESYLAYEEET